MMTQPNQSVGWPVIVGEPDADVKLAVGDAVELKVFGSPSMVITMMSAEIATVVWFAGNKVRSLVVNVNALKRAQ